MFIEAPRKEALQQLAVVYGLSDEAPDELKEREVVWVYMGLRVGLERDASCGMSKQPVVTVEKFLR